MADILGDIVERNRRNEMVGIYAVCSAHPLVLEAAVDQAVQDRSPLLIEATANQSNQFGGYTGMQPADFRKFVLKIAASRGLDEDRVLLGGDHLGPVCWTAEPASNAMSKAEDLVKAYAAAGFRKIHLDCSMPCSDDPKVLADEVVAERAARLCKAAEETATSAFGSSAIRYVIGTEVPPPGGADEHIESLEVTSVQAARHTLRVHEAAFRDAGLTDVWPRVNGLVVQPGVEFDNAAIIDYDDNAATELAAEISEFRNIVFEAHSTDYQLPASYSKLVRDHFAILKVGPQVTFAMREALFALSYIEDELVPASRRSHFRDAVDEAMIEKPSNWGRFYRGSASELKFLRKFSFSDRIRYYWNDSEVAAAMERMFSNLRSMAIPLPLISQFLPAHYLAVRANPVSQDPADLVRRHIRLVLADYSAACSAAN